MGLPMLPTPMNPRFTPPLVGVRMGGLGALRGPGRSVHRTRGAPRLGRGVSERWGAWGALRGPPLQGIEPEDVVPEDLLLARIADGQGEETIHRLWVLGVAVRVVGGGDEVVVAEGVDHVAHELLVALHRAETLPAEVFGGRHGEVGHLAERLAPLVVLVHAVEPEGQPAALRLQEGEA